MPSSIGTAVDIEVGFTPKYVFVGHCADTDYNNCFAGYYDVDSNINNFGYGNGYWDNPNNASQYQKGVISVSNNKFSVTLKNTASVSYLYGKLFYYIAVG